MLYARCAFCGAIVPLWCSGRFMPHMPAAVAATPMGACCSMCGVLPPFFMCGFCGGQQLLLLPGAQPPAPVFPGAPRAFAPVVRAEQGASDSSLKTLFMEFGKGFAGEFGKSVGHAAGSQW